MPAGGGRVSTETRQTERGRVKGEAVEMHEIRTDSRRDEFPDNIQLNHSSM